jgi:hypothetical protein
VTPATVKLGLSANSIAAEIGFDEEFEFAVDVPAFSKIRSTCRLSLGSLATTTATLLWWFAFSATSENVPFLIFENAKSPFASETALRALMY